jgi:hypothetical protein
MKNIALFIKDFQKGTELSNHLVEMDIEITFAESIYDLPDHCKIGIIDLDEEKFSNQEFIAEVKNQSSIILIGYMHKITKGLLDDYKSIGCDIILPKASITKNIKKILIEISK